MKVLIYERDHTGHRFVGVRLLVDALLEVNRALTTPILLTLATTDNALASAEFAEHLSPVCGDLRIVRVAPDAPGLRPQHSFRQALAKSRDLHRLVRHGEFEHLFVPYGDGLIQLLALRRMLPFARQWPASMESEAIMMRTGFAYRSAGWLPRWLGRLALRLSPFSVIHLIDPQAFHFVQTRLPGVASRVSLIPDMIDESPPRDRQSARRALGLPAVGRIVVCLGYLDERKGVDLLIDAFQRVRLDSNDRLLLAGLQTPEVRAQVQAARDTRILTIDRYLSRTELNDAIAAVDLVAVSYQNFTGSASLVIRAAAAQRPCIGTDAGWIGYVINRFGLGSACDVGDREVFSRTLADALDKAGQFVLSEDAQRFVDYCKGDNVRAHWSARLRNRLRLPEHEGYRTWPDSAAH